MILWNHESSWKDEHGTFFHQITEFGSFGEIRLKQIKGTHYLVATELLDLLPKEVVEADPNSRFKQELHKLMDNRYKKLIVKALGKDLPSLQLWKPGEYMEKGPKKVAKLMCTL